MSELTRHTDLMERARLAEPEPARDMDDDETLDAVNTLRRRNQGFDHAMQELIDELLVNKGPHVAITLGLDLDEALED